MAYVTARDAIFRDAPRWLRAFIGQRLNYAGALVQDAITEAATLGARARFPLGGALSVAGALEALGRERRIPRAPWMTDEQYAAKLPGWLDAHRTRGNPYAMLEQLRTRYADAPFPIELVYLGSGKRYTLPMDGSPITTDTVTLPATSKWCRWMLVYQLPDLIPRDGAWDSPGVWDDGGVWDLEWSEDVLEDWLRIPADWNAAHSTGFLALLDPITSDLYNFPGGALDLSGDLPVWTGASDTAIILRVPSPVVLI